ncbi:hypothetical protein GCM10027029_31870 [Conyzicola lurida]
MFSEIPPGWQPDNASRAPLVLVNAVAFSKGSKPPPDQWTHFAKLRPVPWKLFTGFLAIALVCVWGIVNIFVQYPDTWSDNLFFIGAMALGAGFFGWAVIKSVLSYPVRAGWPSLHGLGIGESGIALRLGGGDSDIPWEAVTSVRATVTNELSDDKAHIPVLRIEHSGTAVDFNTQILGASPVVVYRALLYYWLNPASREELGTTVAQQRMDGWVAQIQ